MSDNHYDIIVAGGGLAGTFAAIAAAREGARTALFEQYGFLGGTATTAPVAIFMQYHIAYGDNGEIRELVKGLYEETVNRLRAGGMMRASPFSFDDVALRGVLDDLVTEARVDVLFHSFITGAVVEDSCIQTLQFASKSGLREAAATVFVDSTGDGDLAHLAGAELVVGREDGKTQPMTPVFLVGGIDPQRMPAKKDVSPILRDAFERGTSRIKGVGLWPTPHSDLWLFNTCHVWDHSALDVRELSEAEILGRRQVREIMQDLQAHVPGFEEAYVARAGTQIGVRESRHLVGRYTLTRTDVERCRHFDDGIARCAFEIDIHDMGDGEPQENTVLPQGEFYEIPYRCLLPQGPPENLLIACRALSADHAAHGSLRIMPTMAAVGEAAGIAATRALTHDGRVEAVDSAQLKHDLIARKIMGDPPRSA